MNKNLFRATLSGIFVLCLTAFVLATTYEYDNLHRLVQVTYDNGNVVQYDYDAVGNRTTRVIARHGDINGDGVIDFNDIAAFVAVLLGVDTNPAHIAAADVNGSGTADGADIQAFVNALLTP